jgi:hypothetical protein
VQAQPREGKAEAPTWDERSAERGGLEQAAAISVGPDPAAPVEKGDAPALASADKLADVAPAADVPAKEVAAKLNTKGMGVGGEDLAGDRGNGRASASKREQPAVGNEEATRFDDFGNAGRGVALDEAKAARRRPTDNIAGTLNDGTKAKQSMFGGTANGPGFGVSRGSSGSAESTADDKTMVQRSLDETRKQAERAAPDAVAAATPKVQQQMLPPPAQAAPSQSSPVPALRKSGSYGLPRSAPSQAVDEDSASMTESVARSDELEARRLRDQQLDVDAQLAQSRTAGNSGDRRGEVLAAVAALNAGATGYSRLEALKRACDGYEAMGEFDRAQPYCERVVAEFGGSAAARQVADRRKAQLKSPKSPAPASSKHKLETKTRDEARPAEAR